MHDTSTFRGLRQWPTNLFGSSDDPFRASGMLQFAAVAAGAFLLVFFGWALFSRLDSAVSANGVVGVESKRKKIQHLQGGLIDTVYVHNGDRVEAGQRLVALNRTQSAAALGIVLAEQDAILGLEARLQAEIDDADRIVFSPELTERAGIASADASMRGQRRLFERRRETFRDTIRVLESRRDQLKKAISGLEAQRRSSVVQADLIAQEREGIQQLYNQGFATLPRLLALKRAQAALGGQQGNFDAQVAEYQLKINETDVEMLRLKGERLDAVAADMREAQRKKFELDNRIRAARDTVERSVITAPSAGVVTALRVFSPGEVVQPGVTLMEVVPQNDQLVVEAHIDPNDADDVRAGMAARVQLSAFRTRARPVVGGRVRSVSADRLTDERTGAGYYLVEVEVDRKEVRTALGGAPLQPGLPAEVMISLGEHTPLEYLLAPINRRMRHAMTEP